MPGLSDTTMGRTSCCVPSSACHQDQDSAILGMSPTSGPRCPQRVTNTGTAPLGKKKELHLRAGTAGFVPALVLWGTSLLKTGETAVRKGSKHPPDCEQRKNVGRANLATGIKGCPDCSYYSTWALLLRSKRNSTCTSGAGG
ncbi:hypothetical protein AV530_000911 [Patagioenas fasciata monilis]|nr:hypothetical protein AV530_000911 [Patagioenas fasciata monilis]